MRMKMLMAAGALTIWSPQPANAQNIDPKQVYGHQEWREVGEERRRELYEIASGLPFAERSFRFTSGSHLSLPAAQWTEYDVQLDGQANGRIVAEIGLADGKYAAEYYFDAGHLLLVYETRYFVEQAAPQPVTTNFKGIAAWERLSIFVEDRIHYSHGGGRGAPQPGSGGETLLANSMALMREFAPTD